MSATKGLFGKYLNRIFIETGCNIGDGIQQAIDEEFHIIYSCDTDSDHYWHCVERFKDVKNVYISHSDSVSFLRAIMPSITEPVTFWLDAHKGNGKSPALHELEIIRDHYIKTHTILIDDLRDWRKEKCGFDTALLKQRITKINPDYKFSFEDGFAPRDILAAYV